MPLYIKMYLLKQKKKYIKVISCPGWSIWTSIPCQRLLPLTNDPIKWMYPQVSMHWGTLRIHFLLWYALSKADASTCSQVCTCTASYTPHPGTYLSKWHWALIHILFLPYQHFFSEELPSGKNLDTPCRGYHFKCVWGLGVHELVLLKYIAVSIQSRSSWLLEHLLESCPYLGKTSCQV